MLRPLNLTDLPDDVLLRIISLTGALRSQIGTAYSLGSVCIRFRRMLYSAYLPGILHISYEVFYALSLADASAAKAAVNSMFSAVTNIKTLNLSGCSPGLISPHSVSGLVRVARHSLIEINFAHSNISDDVLCPFMTCTNLRRLILPSCGITGSMFRQAKRVAPVEELDLSWMPSLTHEGVLAVASVVTLKKLVLKGCNALNCASLQAFLESDVKQSLERVCFAFCPLDDGCIVNFLRCTPHLKELVLANNARNVWPQGQYTFEAIESMREEFPNVNITLVT
eukprot:TRINITY_DN1993_c0_g1_i1.p1 TRINITY_DN1993_c0_g1~~TRINITY_DN1993_c0_g1_i1.p1  ORF type:complete len:282 (+),score=24.38 TRINITY_DN1993_c0_g1_i1:315-1160(+)